jgi:hypothetical protein
MTDDWFEADTWPLEAAIAWLLYGDRRLCGPAAALACERREHPSRKLPTLAMRLLINEGLAATVEAKNGSPYRSNMRTGWAPGARAEHPFTRALKSAATVMVGRPAAGRCDDGQRVSIPPKIWRSARLVDDRQRGLTLVIEGPKETRTWRDIDVPAAPFRSFRTKRGRRPAGITTGVTGEGVKNIERLKTKYRHQKIRWGQENRERPISRSEGYSRSFLKRRAEGVNPRSQSYS